MAIPHSLHEISMDVSKDVMHVYKDQRAMNELVAKLCKAMQDQGMQEEICSHMQTLLHESTLAAGGRRKRYGATSLQDSKSTSNVPRKGR